MDANFIKPRAGLFRRLPHVALIALAAHVAGEIIAENAGQTCSSASA